MKSASFLVLRFVRFRSPVSSSRKFTFYRKTRTQHIYSRMALILAEDAAPLVMQPVYSTAPAGDSAFVRAANAVGAAVPAVRAVGGAISSGYRAVMRPNRARRQRRKRQNKKQKAPSKKRRSSAKNVSGAGLSSARPTRAPVAMQTSLRQDYSNLKSYTLSHSEYVADISGSIPFSNQQFVCNPGSCDTFPWLCAIARNYEQFIWRKLKFHLKTMTSTTSVGTVAMAFDYDPTDRAPSNKNEILAYSGAIRAAPWIDSCLALDRSSVRSSPHYVGGVLPDDDAAKRQTVPAILNVATQGQSGGAVISELWVEYTVELLTPQSNPNCPINQFEYAGDMSLTSRQILLAELFVPSLNGTANNFDIGGSFPRMGRYFVRAFVAFVSGQAQADYTKAVTGVGAGWVIETYNNVTDGTATGVTGVLYSGYVTANVADGSFNIATTSLPDINSVTFTVSQVPLDSDVEYARV